MFAHSAQAVLPGWSSRIQAIRRAAIWLVCGLAAQGLVLKAQVSIAGPMQIRMNGTGQYKAFTGGVATSAVVWSVNGVAHGNSSTGSISASGFYTPANTIWAGHSVVVSVSTTANPTVSASLNVKLVNPLPVFSYATLTATAPGVYLLDVHGSGFLAASQLTVAGVNASSTYVSATELQSSISLPNGTMTVTVAVFNPNAAQSAPVGQTLTVPTAPLATLAQATRLLDQSTFGPPHSRLCSRCSKSAWWPISIGNSRYRPP